MMRQELADNGPVIYSGNDGSVGHAFVLDGYTDQGYYSLNWGWGSYCDGYYTLDALNPSGQGIGGSEGGYNLGQTAILNVKKEEGGYADVRGVIYTYNDISGLQADRTVFEPGVTFLLSTGLLVNAGSETFTGPMGFVIMDADDQAKEVVASFNAELPVGYGYFFDRTALQFSSELEFGDHLIAAMYDSRKGKWVKMLAEKTEGAVDAIPLCDAASIAQSTSFEYNTQTKVITLGVKDGVSASVLTEAGAVADGVVQSSGNVVTVATASLEPGRYRLILSKASEAHEMYFVVGSEE